MLVTEKNLEKFRRWLVERGRSDGTADTYCANLVMCQPYERTGMAQRLLDRGLSPNTLRVNLAALRAWARFSQDGELAARLTDMRLPSARRIRVKAPLTPDQHQRFIAHVKTCRWMAGPMRQAILLLALRGFRSGDVLRMQRVQIVRALKAGRLVFEGKGRKQSSFAIAAIREPLEALAEMTGWERVRDLITTSPTPKIASKRLARAVRRVARELGISDMHPHRFRHTVATRFLAELHGDPNALTKLQKYMDWESIATAARYTDAVSQDELDAIGERLAKGFQ